MTLMMRRRSASTKVGSIDGRPIISGGVARRLSLNAHPSFWAHIPALLGAYRAIAAPYRAEARPLAA